MKKKILSLALTLVMCLGLTTPAFATTIVNSGKCGPNLTWTMDDNGTLTIKGTGKMDNFPDDPNAHILELTEHAHAPWSWYGYIIAEDPECGDPYLTNVIIEDGVTSIGEAAFLLGYSLNTISIPRSVTYIGPGAFSECFLDSVYYGGSEAEWNKLLSNTDTSEYSVFSESSLLTAKVYFNNSSSEQPSTPDITVEDIPASGMASASTQAVEVDDKKIEFQMYALLDENGNGTNYVKLRDLAHVLNGTKAQFSVGYSSGTGITVTSSQPYEDNGSEMNTPFSGDRAYTGGGQSVQVNGKAVEMTAINLLDDQGGGYNYFKLRDLGTALGFKVDWSAARGIYIETK